MDLQDRLILESITNKILISTSAGALIGLFTGARIAALQYNAQTKKPSNKAGWYLYHKRKNYAMTLEGFRYAAKYGIRMGSVISAYYAVDSLLDRQIGVKWYNSLSAGVLVSAAFSVVFRLPLSMAKKAVFSGGLLGLSSSGLYYLQAYLEDKNGSLMSTKYQPIQAE